MRWLSRARPDDGGAVVVLVAVATLALVGMAALVVDVGAILDERRQLQNGADAGALAVAHSCALGPCDAGAADRMADENARDDESAASVTYPATDRVRVDTSTSHGGTNILPYSFGQILTGVKGKTVRATATARWAPPGRAPAIPLAISQCDVTQLGIGKQAVIRFHTTLGPCQAKDASGAFGWLNGACPTTFEAGVVVSGDPGSSGPKDCLDPLIDTEILVPVFDTTTGTGTNTKYNIVGFAALHLTGWRFAGDQSSPRPCNAPDTCIAGTFVRYVTPAEAGGGADFGVSTVFLVS